MNKEEIEMNDLLLKTESLYRRIQKMIFEAKVYFLIALILALINLEILWIILLQIK